METNTQQSISPKEFYRSLRPENFSDSSVVSEVVLPRELLAYELDKITTNQKQDQFETLARRLAEKLISPNLIPQTGPTGGGDGKTDSETYPVSSSISSRWFVPEKGWTNDEKWAFAISAKEEWRSKLKADIISILSTGRDYTKIYFITSQRPSSKLRKKAEEDFSKEYNNLDIIVLDGNWILEKIYNNNLVDVAVDSLNLSNVYKTKIEIGPEDSNRIKKIK